MNYLLLQIPQIDHNCDCLRSYAEAAANVWRPEFQRHAIHGVNYRDGKRQRKYQPSNVAAEAGKRGGGFLKSGSSLTAELRNHRYQDDPEQGFGSNRRKWIKTIDLGQG